ncbi:site-specific integrase [Sphaerisporangium sp. NPDC051011]|uniref:tyrosine-type recombinase/integrase n=1 Tax=Sphaerisporangium sp. NPDC051011 TaxID=3155792 RepID=UPI0033C4C3E4
MAKTNRRQHGEGSIYQRADGRWTTEIHLGWRNGKPLRKYLYGKDPDEVLEKRQQFEADRAEGYIPEPGRAPTVEAWIDKWLNDIAKVEPKTKAGYKSKIKNHIRPVLGHIRLDELTEEPIEAMYADMRRGGYAESSILMTHRILSRALKIAVQRRHTTKLKRNPCDNIEMHRPTRPDILPPEVPEAAQILTAARTRRNRARWPVALSLGLRQGEGLGMLWPLINVTDLDRASVKVAWEIQRHTWEHGCADPHACGARLHRYPCPAAGCPKAARPSGRRHVCVRRCPKNCTQHDDGKCPTFCEPRCTRHAVSCPQRRGGGLVLKRPKTETSLREVHIPRPLAEMLVAHRKWQLEERMRRRDTWAGWGHDKEQCTRRQRPREVVCPDCRKPFDLGALVFAQPDGMPVDPRQDWQEWTDMLDELGLPHYRPHDARHFAATLLMALGVDVRVVQEILGHSSSSFTRDTYQHVASTLQVDAMQKLGEALWGAGS